MTVFDDFDAASGQLAKTLHANAEAHETCNSATAQAAFWRDTELNDKESARATLSRQAQDILGEVNQELDHARKGLSRASLDEPNFSGVVKEPPELTAGDVGLGQSHAEVRTISSALQKALVDLRWVRHLEWRKRLRRRAIRVGAFGLLFAFVIGTALVLRITSEQQRLATATFVAQATASGVAFDAGAGEISVATLPPFTTYPGTTAVAQTPSSVENATIRPSAQPTSIEQGNTSLAAPTQTVLAVATGSNTINCVLTVLTQANLRSGPGKDSSVIRALSVGEVLHADDRQPGPGAQHYWWHVSTGGWVREDLVSESGDCSGTNGVSNNACPGALPSRLVANGHARVTPGPPNRIRAAATTTSEILGQIPPGGVFLVQSGPTCAEGYTWWSVNYNGISGFTVESDSTSYFVDPMP